MERISERPFVYTYKAAGKKVAGSLYYNPLDPDYGLEYIKKTSCCLQFAKGDKLVRIKTGTQLVIIEQKGKSRPISKGLPVPKSAHEFEKLLRECQLI